MNSGNWSVSRSPTRRRRASTHRQRGFSLMEVIVAMVLLSTTGLAMVAWINQSLETTGRMQARLDEAAVLRLSSAWIHMLDLPRQEQGEEEHFGIRVRWKATPALPAVRNAGFATDGLGTWLVGVYRVDVRAADRNGQHEVHYSALVLSTAKQ